MTVAAFTPSHRATEAAKAVTVPQDCGRSVAGNELLPCGLAVPVQLCLRQSCTDAQLEVYPKARAMKTAIWSRVTTVSGW